MMLRFSPKSSFAVTPEPHRRAWPWSKPAVGLVALVPLRLLGSVDSWKEHRVTKYDVFGYYLYLPATFNCHDLAGLCRLTGWRHTGPGLPTRCWGWVGGCGFNSPFPRLFFRS